MRIGVALVTTVVLVVTGLLLLTAGEPGPPPPPPGSSVSPTAAVTSNGTPSRSPNGTSAVEEQPAATLVMWSRGDLSSVVADRASGLPDVVATAFVRSDTLGLVGARAADGTVADALEDGWRIPVDVAAVEPEAYASTLDDPAVREAVRGLAPGQVLLPQTAAELRGIGTGGRIDLVGLVGLEVAGVVPDGTFRRAEIVLHVDDADAAGLDPDGSLILRHRAPDGARRRTLEDGLRALAPPDEAVRIVDIAEGAPRYRAPLVLSLVEVKARFGEFAFRPRPGTRDIDVEQAWVDRHITSAEVPILGSVTCHEGILGDLRGALTEIVEAGLASSIDPADYGGCFHPRLISEGRGRLSHHSWGIALDINVDLSQPGLGPPPPPEVIEILGRHGFRWGGDFLSPDNHHFEWLGREATRRPG